MDLFTDHVVDFVAGLLGGCGGLIVGHAFDTIKVRQQTLSNPNIGRGAYGAIRATFVHDGLLGFYKGMAFPLVSVGCLNSIFFGVYGNTVRSLTTYRYGSKDARPAYLDVFLVGGFSGAVQAFPACTIELVKVKLQSQTNAGVPGAALSSRYRGPISSVVFMIHKDHGLHGIFRGISQRLPGHKALMQPMSQTPEAPKFYRGPVHCLRSLYRDHGLRGTFRGLEATILREVPGFAIYMISYEYLCDYLTPGRLDLPRGVAVDPAQLGRWGDVEEPLERLLPEPNVGTLLLAGGLAGTLSWLGNIPFDVVKNRLQADNLASPSYKNYVDCVRKSYRTDGFRVFWRGLPVTCIRAFPVNAVTFAIYSTTMSVMQKLASEKHQQSLI